MELTESIERMVIRDIRVEDLPAIKAIHESVGIDYQMPEIGMPFFFIRKVVELDGEVVSAAVLRIEAEMYLWLKRGSWATAGQKRLMMKMLQDVILHEAHAKHIPNVVCWVPRHVERFFAKDLEALGWSRDREGWISWSRETS